MMSNIYKLPRVTYAFLVIIISLLSGCDWFSSNSSKQVTNNQETIPVSKNLILIDVNEDAIYNDAHIKGSTHIPYSKLDNLDVISSNWDKKAQIVVYCTNYQCLASKDVAKKLKELGFNNVSVYTGGVAQWYQLGLKDKSYKIEGTLKEDYLKNEIEPVVPSDKEISVMSAADLKKHIEDFHIAN